MRALKLVEGMDKLGPAYLIAKESATERVNTLRMGLMLVFMELVVGCIICCCARTRNIDLHYYAKSLPLCRVGFGEKCNRTYLSGVTQIRYLLTLKLRYVTTQFVNTRSNVECTIKNLRL